MAPGKIRRALGAVKDKTSIGLAKVSHSNTISDLEVAVVKATRHEEQPAEERYIREILSLTSYSHAHMSACINTLSKRLNKTKTWTVALKALIVIHRLLLEGDPAYESEIYHGTRRGTRLLNMSDFRDRSRSNSWDYSAFVRTFALYLEDRLEFRMQGRRRGRRSIGLPSPGYDDENEEEATRRSPPPVKSTTPVHELKSIELIFNRVQHLQLILERFLACRPTGEAKHSRVVMVALCPMVKESFQTYHDISEIIGIFIDRFMDLDVRDCVRIHEIFARLGKQFDELDSFYSWGQQVGIGKSSDYPEVKKISLKKLEIMDDFIRDKSALAQRKKSNIIPPEQQKDKEVLDHKDDQQQQVVIKQEEEEKEDMLTIKALPPPETFSTDDNKKEVDLLDLHSNDNTMTTEEHDNKLALALFDGISSQAPGWEAFNSEDSGDWETALVQSASNLSNQKTSLAGGFDMLLLDSMYQQSAATVATQGAYGGGGIGSASSVAMPNNPPPTTATMLALPAPPVVSGNNVDPFAASLVVPPPAYVQMSELEKKQKLLMEEQMMWQQYTRDGMQGQLGLMKLQQNQQYYYPYNNMGGYTHSC